MRPLAGRREQQHGARQHRPGQLRRGGDPGGGVERQPGRGQRAQPRARPASSSSTPTATTSSPTSPPTRATAGISLENAPSERGARQRRAVQQQRHRAAGVVRQPDRVQRHQRLLVQRHLARRASLNNVVVSNTSDGNDAEGISVEAEVLPESTEPGNLIDRNIDQRQHQRRHLRRQGRVTGSRRTSPTTTAAGASTPRSATSTAAATGPPATPSWRSATRSPATVRRRSPPEVAPPDTLIVDEPANPSNSTSASFTFTGIDDNTPLFELAFECRLDSTSETAWVECENPQTYGNLTAGTHTFQVRAVDLSDKVDPTPATYTWVVALLAARRTAGDHDQCRAAGPDARDAPRCSPSSPTSRTPRSSARWTGRRSPTASRRCSTRICFRARTSSRSGRGTRRATSSRRRPPARGRSPVRRWSPWWSRRPLEDTSTTATFAFVANEPVTRFECSLDLARVHHLHLPGGLRRPGHRRPLAAGTGGGPRRGDLRRGGDGRARVGGGPRSGHHPAGRR